ncbi:MAG: sodium-dependent transporter [Polyangiaceae bacterium]|nr:sodium-dependent transporter [Polyangiaceae bacterium]
MRESWKSRWGLILAAAGNAVGIGNLLRFPGQAAQNGGGAFILPYLISLVIFGLPMMWVAWTIGRLGGRHGHGTLPGIFDKLTSWRGAKYLGALGVAGPLVFCFYYTYLEAWCLGYSWFSFRGTYETAHLRTFLAEFQGVVPSGNYFANIDTALVFLVITVALNVWVLYRGVSGGIELLAKIAMPLLLLFCVLMCVRIFTLPDAKGSVTDGLGFLWNPDFSALGKPNVWLAAAGQVFFTLSIGFGALEVYASYLGKNDDVAVTGLTTAATNEFVEIIFGSMIAIPAAAVFFGAAAIPEVASSGTFDIGMVSMPEILRATHSTTVFGTIWFLLLFFAAFTSSVAVCQPVMAFLQDEAKLKRGSAAALIGVFWLLGSLPVVFFLRYGFLDELDFWAGTLGLVVISAIEVILFAWVFGMDKGWAELHRGSLMTVPRVFRFILQYVTPIALIAVLTGWVYSDVVMGGKLSPKPSLVSGFLNRDDFPGEFQHKAPKEGSPEATEHGVLKSALMGAVDASSRDLKVWAHLEMDDSGVRVTELEGDPTFKAALPAKSLERMLNLEHYRYEVKGKRAPAKATMVLEGLYTKPYIWLARGLILGLIAMFAVMVAVVWHHRGKDDDDDEESPPRSESPSVDEEDDLAEEGAT